MVHGATGSMDEVSVDRISISEEDKEDAPAYVSTFHQRQAVYNQQSPVVFVWL